MATRARPKSKSPKRPTPKAANGASRQAATRNVSRNVGKRSRRDEQLEGGKAPNTGEPSITLAEIIEDLGPEVIRVIAAPKNLTIPVREPVIFDLLGPPSIEQGDLVVAVGMSVAGKDAIDLLDGAAEAGASGVIFKLEGAAPREVIERASSRGVDVAAVPYELTWEQLLRFVRTAIASTGATLDQTAAGVPVGDLFALANAVAEMVGGPVSIEDPQSRVLAYSSLDEPIDVPRRQTILGRQVPERWIKRLNDEGVFRRMWAGEDAVRFEGRKGEGLKPRLSIAVRAGEEILGSIWVAEGRKPLGADAELALREASRMAALHLIRHRTARDLEIRRRSELVRSAIEGSGPTELVAARLGVDVAGHFTVVAFELHPNPEPDGAIRRERLVDLVGLYAESLSRRASSVVIGDVLYLLLPTTIPVSNDQVTSLASKIVDRGGAGAGAKLSAGIGNSVSHLEQIPVSRWEADQALRALTILSGEKRVAHIESVRPQTVIMRLKELASEQPELKAGKLAALIDHDSKHGTAYVNTLRAFLDSFGDIGVAADKVGVHPNTFRYRIRRLEELSGMSLADPDERLVTELQLRFL